MPLTQPENILIRNAEAVHLPANTDFTATPDIRISGGLITEIGINLSAGEDERVIDASHCVIYPGFVNTHHHLAQSILKAVPAGINQSLGDWLGSVPYRFWPSITPEMMYVAAKVALYEQMRSGVTTCADHHYLYHANTSPEVEAAVWQAAEDLGVRFALCRGAATGVGSHKGMSSHNIQPESVDQVIARLEQSYTHHHQSSSNAMQRLVVAPTSMVHTSPREHLKVLAQWARAHELRLHSHLLEVAHDEAMSQQNFGMSAIDYAESCDMLGKDVWFAHLVKADQAGIEKLAATGTSIAHCPTSNCRLGSGIAPVTAMRKAGMRITLGVDGSASAEAASMLQELNMAWLLHRSQFGAEATHVEEVIDWGSRNGADLLGLNTGRIEIGTCADLVLFDIDAPRYAGMHSLLEAPVMCGEPASIKYSFVNGRQVIDNGQVAGIDEHQLAHEARTCVKELLERAPGA